MTLEQLLDDDPADLRWRCAHEQAVGAKVLGIARPGLLLEPIGELMPRSAFHRWMFDGAERLLRAHVGFGQLESHEADWLGQGVALLAEPLPRDAPTRGVVLMTMASLNTFAAIRSGPREMGEVYGWTCDALSWASKRLLADRHCPHDPVSLNRRLAELHGRLANFGGESTDATTSERTAQVVGLVGAWRAVR